MKFTAILTLLFALVLGSAQAQDCVDPELINPEAICGFIWAPVCGCDGITYGNECEATNFGGVTSWTEGECTGTGGDCVDPDLINPDILCTSEWAPVCGCNGVTYGNACEAENWGGVTSWVDGECSGGAGDCINFSGLDFGACDMVLGVGLVNGVCTWISGCGTVASDGVDYAGFFFDNEDACAEACGGVEPGPCADLSGVDFGDCDMVLGVAYIDGTCQSVDGCDYTINGTDFTSFFYGSIEDCQAGCDGLQCLSQELLDPDMNCDQAFGYVCGCDSMLYASACDAMYAGGVSDWDEGPCPNPIVCVEDAQIDLSVPCPLVFDPVCGCDGITYDNACSAFYIGGVQAWEPGACDGGQSIGEHVLAGVQPMPNPATTTLSLTGGKYAQMRILDTRGRVILELTELAPGAQLNVAHLPQGLYLLEIQIGGATAVRRFEKR